ncbi:hypothetical protein FJT64_004359 [Amphibalanus amphitrite]|uniref:Uncharacterized protein n=1 Tax=Amphibalanus amphitrite TaxID=1232801 RepID=A0A6A4VU06_AMPAM|nr:hypothetical protein FJT64_004359 [Amphibalanus amphitrite]
MSPLRHLQLICHHVWRRANILLPALLITVLLMVLLQDYDFRQPAMPHSPDSERDTATSNPDIGVYELRGCNCSRKYSKSAYRTLNGTRSNCGITADIRGAKQNVISFSFYGIASSVFFRGIEANLAKVPEIYPGWVVRVYNDINMSEPRQRELVCDVQCRYDNVDFCDVHDLPGLGDLSKKFGMIWRFMPLADGTVERFIVRDLDSLIGWRERAAVDDWIASNRTFHAMRDAPAHGTEILGGMWGGWNRYNSIYKPARDRIIKVTQQRYKPCVFPQGLDQDVLTAVLWPLIQQHRDLISHDSYLCLHYPMTKPFPKQRESPFDFVGSPSLFVKGIRLKSIVRAPVGPQSTRTGNGVDLVLRKTRSVIGVKGTLP